MDSFWRDRQQDVGSAHIGKGAAVKQATHDVGTLSNVPLRFPARQKSALTSHTKASMKSLVHHKVLSAVLTGMISSAAADSCMSILCNTSKLATICCTCASYGRFISIAAKHLYQTSPCTKPRGGIPRRMLKFQGRSHSASCNAFMMNNPKPSRRLLASTCCHIPSRQPCSGLLMQGKQHSIMQYI